MKHIIKIGLAVLSLVILSNCAQQKVIKPEDFAKLQAENSSLTSENARLSSDISNLAAQNQSQMNELNLKKNQLTALQDERDNLLKVNTRYSNDMIATRNLVDSTKNDLGKQIAGYKTAIDNNNLKMKSLSGEISNRQYQISDLQNQIKTLSAEQSKLLDEKNREISNLTATHASLEKSLQQEVADGNLKIQQLGDMLTIDFLDKIFFDSGSADVRNSGKKTLDKLAAVLSKVKDKEIKVEGYTDNVPIAEKYRWKYPSNWELSTGRAATIVRYLESKGVDPALMKANGYGEYNPVAPNDTPEGRAQNRRIVVLLVPLTEENRYK